MAKKKRVIDLSTNGDGVHLFSDRPKPKEDTCRPLTPKTEHQAEYIRSICENHITLCYGPAGCGKTFISAGLAANWLVQQKIKKIVITRPVVESGERLGYLPGDVAEKMEPYLLPIMDELKRFLSERQVKEFLNATNGGIEIAPLAYLRGRSLHDAFVILDEAQNCTRGQLKMFLTRLGNNSTMVINGDLDQTDLRGSESGGLKDLIELLNGVEGVGICRLTEYDIVRNPIIAKVLNRLKEF